MSTDFPPLRLPSRAIPVPTSISEQARAVLAQGAVVPPEELPAADDLDAWRAYVAERDNTSYELFAARMALDEIRSEQIDLGEFVVHAIEPDGAAQGGAAPDDAVPGGAVPGAAATGDRRVYLDIHGGGFVHGGGKLVPVTGYIAANTKGTPVWAVDYRLPPDHPFPAALDDCLTAYRALLDRRRPSEIIVGGVSAGGNLAAALLLRARDEGLPMPAALVLDTPAVDLTGAGDSWHTNDGLDIVLTGSLASAVELYAGGYDVRDPYLSPLFGDPSGFPPTILTSGTRDRLLSDTVRMHRALRTAGVPADLHVFEAAGHGMFLGAAPEDQEKVRELRRFLDQSWRRAGTLPA